MTGVVRATSRPRTNTWFTSISKSEMLFSETLSRIYVGLSQNVVPVGSVIEVQRIRYLLQVNTHAEFLDTVVWQFTTAAFLGPPIANYTNNIPTQETSGFSQSQWIDNWAVQNTTQQRNQTFGHTTDLINPVRVGATQALGITVGTDLITPGASGVEAFSDITVTFEGRIHYR